MAFLPTQPPPPSWFPPPMERVRYYVVLHGGEWKISYADQHYGPYRSQAEAIRYAVDAAHELGKSGVDSQVMVQGQDNRFRVEWTYGHDPFPPRG